MRYKVAFDTTDAVGESIRDVVYTVGSAILLVILVIFLFLGDWRTTMIHFIATPVSLIGTFIFVKLLGFSINTLTLFGITLATGLVVDDAIVVIENIERHITEGEHDSHKAAAAATAEITSAVIATSLVLCAVFVPVAFFPGTTGILFRQFALTIAFSIAISAFNALTLAPVLAAIFLSGPTAKNGGGCKSLTMECLPSRAGYRAVLHHVLDYKLVMVLLFFVGLGLTYLVFTRVPGGFVPNEDQGISSSSFKRPLGHLWNIRRPSEDRFPKLLSDVSEAEGTLLDCGLRFLRQRAESGNYFVPA